MDKWRYNAAKLDHGRVTEYSHYVSSRECMIAWTTVFRKLPSVHCGNWRGYPIVPPQQILDLPELVNLAESLSHTEMPKKKGMSRLMARRRAKRILMMTRVGL